MFVLGLVSYNNSLTSLAKHFSETLQVPRVADSFISGCSVPGLNQPEVRALPEETTRC